MQKLVDCTTDMNERRLEGIGKSYLNRVLAKDRGLRPYAMASYFRDDLVQTNYFSGSVRERFKDAQHLMRLFQPAVAGRIVF